jgi:hypothetical protein
MSMRIVPLLLACAVALDCASLPAAEQHRSGGPYVPTPQPVVEEMLKLAGVSANDYVIDLGSGDGRIVLTAAARYRARGMGVELDGKLVENSNAQAQRQKLDRYVKFVQQDALKTSLKGATVVTLYLLPDLMNQLRDRLYAELPPGARVVSHDFAFADWRQDRSTEVSLREKFQMPGDWVSSVYLWIVPAKVEGRWQAAVGGAGNESFVLQFTQSFQEVAGEALGAAGRFPVRGGRLEGAKIRFRIVQSTAAGSAAREFTGQVDGDVIRGEVAVAGAKAPWSARRIRAPGER